MRRRTRNAPATGMTPRLRPDSRARLAARCQEDEEAVIRILVDALTSPASLVQRFGSAAIPSDQIRKMISRAADIAAASSEERAKLVRGLVEKVIVEEKTITITLRR